MSRNNLLKEGNSQISWFFLSPLVTILNLFTIFSFICTIGSWEKKVREKSFALLRCLPLHSGHQVYSIINPFKGLKAAARFNRPYKSLQPLQRMSEIRWQGEGKTGLNRLNNVVCMPFYSRGLETQSAFLAATLLCAEHIMQLPSWHRSSLQWKPSSWMGFLSTDVFLRLICSFLQ